MNTIFGLQYLSQAMCERKDRDLDAESRRTVLQPHSGLVPFRVAFEGRLQAKKDTYE